MRKTEEQFLAELTLLGFKITTHPELAIDDGILDWQARRKRLFIYCHIEKKTNNRIYGLGNSYINGSYQSMDLKKFRAHILKHIEEEL